MSETTPTFLEVIRSRLAEIERQRKALDDESAELEVARKVAERLIPTVHYGQARLEGEGSATINGQTVSVITPRTQSDLIIATLRSSSDADPWFPSTGALRDEVNRIHGVFIKDNSYYAVLNGLGKKGVTVKDGPRIALAERIPPQSQQPSEVQCGGQGDTGERLSLPRAKIGV